MLFTPLVTRADLLAEYAAALEAKSPATADAYLRAVRQWLDWLQDRPNYAIEAGGTDYAAPRGTTASMTAGFHPDQFTRTAVETYLVTLEAHGMSVSHRARVKSALSSFAEFLIEEKEWLRRNPTRRIGLPAQALLAPRILSAEQRYALRSLIEREDSPRSAALFALGYWAGCRVSDVAWLRVADTHLSRKTGWLRVGYKGGKLREIDLALSARQALAHYLTDGAASSEGAASPREYVFTSQRRDRLTEAGIHHWLRALKRHATKAEWDLLHDVTYHDLRHDFAHRARAAGWSLEEVAYYLGHVTKKGTPAIQTTARYTQVSREQVKEKIHLLR
jgi:site-specific recombinase XerD